MSYIFPLIFWLLACVGIGLAMYFKGKMGVTDTRPGELNTYIQENAHLTAELAGLQKLTGELSRELQNEKSEKDQLSGKWKQVYKAITDLEAKYDSLTKEKEKILQDLTHFQAEEKRKTEEFDKKISQLDNAKNVLEDEKKRIQREDEEQVVRERGNRDRMWAEHEEKVKGHLAELCKLPQYNFQTYDNKNLPEGFGGKFKPDFMIEFLGQYIIFDAKVSRSDNLQQYVSTNVKSTAEKINNDIKIYPMVFFIVPTDAIASLTRTHFQEQGYEFFIISPEAVPVILASFKKISTYELAEQLDPRDRENIVSLIAEFDHHINMRNALDIIASQTGIAVLSKAHSLKKDLKEEISMKKSKMRIQQPSAIELKTLMLDTENQQEAVSELVSPQSSIPENFLDSASVVMSKK